MANDTPRCSTCDEIAEGGGACSNPFHITGDPAWDSANLAETVARQEAARASQLLEATRHGYAQCWMDLHIGTHAGPMIAYRAACAAFPDP